MKPIVAANWKMNFTIDESLNLIDEIIKRSPSVEAEIIFFQIISRFNRSSKNWLIQRIW